MKKYLKNYTKIIHKLHNYMQWHQNRYVPFHIDQNEEQIIFVLETIGWLCSSSQKPTASNLKAPSSALKLATMRKVRETGWTAVSKMDRKRKIKDSEKLFS